MIVNVFKFNFQKLNCVSNEKWQEAETEVEKLDQTEPEYKSSVGFLTENEIAFLADTIDHSKHKANLGGNKSRRISKPYGRNQN